MEQTRRLQEIYEGIQRQTRQQERLQIKDVYINEAGITLLFENGQTVVLPVAVVQRLKTLITMAELAKLVPAEPETTP